MQVDVGQQWGGDTTLRDTRFAPGELVLLHNSGFEKLPDQVQEVLVCNPSFDQTQELPVLNDVKIALDVSLDHIEVFATFIEEGHQDRDSIHRTAPFAKAVGVQAEIRFKDRIKDCPEGFLDKAVSESR